MLLLTVRVAVATPAMVGANVIWASVDAPAASVLVPGRPAENCAAPVPLIENGVLRVTEKLLVLVMVTGNDTGEPAVTTAKLRVVGLAVSVAAMTPIVKDASPEQPLASVARMVTGYDPAAVGAPATVPVEASESPGGKLPVEVVNVYGLVPPLPISVCE